MRKFELSHTETAATTAEKVWDIWKDINSWPEWDAGLTKTKFKGEFKQGETFKLKPKGSPFSVTNVLEEITEPTRFINKADLGFATIEAIHELADDGNGNVAITHKIIANVQENRAGFFEKNIWSSIQKAVPVAVQNLAKRAAS